MNQTILSLMMFVYVGLPLCLIARYLRKIYILLEKRGGTE